MQYRDYCFRKHIPNAANKLVLRIIMWVPYATAQSSKLFSSKLKTTVEKYS
jgi:hypothetical protein